MQRTIAGLGVLAVFGALFVLPLWAALSICSMPCCERSSNTVVASPMPECATECGMRAVDARPASVTAWMPDTSAHRAASIVVAVVHLTDSPATHTPTQRDANTSHRAADAALHVLNSVFRI